MSVVLLNQSSIPVKSCYPCESKPQQVVVCLWQWGPIFNLPAFFLSRTKHQIKIVTCRVCVAFYHLRQAHGCHGDYEILSYLWQASLGSTVGIPQTTILGVLNPTFESTSTPSGRETVGQQCEWCNNNPSRVADRASSQRDRILIDSSTISSPTRPVLVHLWIPCLERLISPPTNSQWCMPGQPSHTELNHDGWHFISNWPGASKQDIKTQQDVNMFTSITVAGRRTKRSNSTQSYAFPSPCLACYSPATVSPPVPHPIDSSPPDIFPSQQGKTSQMTILQRTVRKPLLSWLLTGYKHRQLSPV